MNGNERFGCSLDTVVIDEVKTKSQYSWQLYYSRLLTVILLSRLVQTMDYSVIVFDTAPTGHTLRLLQFPSTLEKGLGKVMDLKNRFGGLISQVSFLYYLKS